MPIYNFGTGIYTYNNGIYTYNNGNLTSNTTIVNGIPYTQNIMMLNGTGAGCGDKPCSQGYSLYFPCLKNITRGEDVCFEFYVVNNATKDVVDLRTVDGLTINLGGSFGCSLGTYMYPSEDGFIRPLQSQTYKSVLNENFKERDVFNLTVSGVDDSFDILEDINISGRVGKFYKDDVVRLEAFDTDTHIFVGWIDVDSEEDEECEDFYISEKRVLSFEIKRDTNIAAVYRPRKKFNIFKNEGNSFYTCLLNGNEVTIGDAFSVDEGKHLVVRAVPLNCIFKEWDTSLFGESTHTSSDNIVMEITVNSDITLKINSIQFDETENTESDFDENIDFFDMNFLGFSIENLVSLCGIELHSNSVERHKLEENTLFDELLFHNNDNISELFENCEPLDYGHLYSYYIGRNGFLKFGDKESNGFLELENPGIENETIVEVYCKKMDEGCSVSVSIDDETQIQEIFGDDTNRLLFSSEKTDFEKIRISSLGEIFPEEKPGECLVDRMEISDIVIIDKGKAVLCLPGSVTEKFHRGKITATGAIMIKNSYYGLPCTSVGNVSGNPTITHLLK